MKMMLAIILSCFVLVATAQNSQEDGEYENDRKGLCEKKDMELYKEMDACFKQEHQNVQDAQVQCAKESYPESNGNLPEFFAAACADKSIFKTFDACFAKYEEDAEFRRQMETTDEIEACYNDVLEKYDVKDE